MIRRKSLYYRLIIALGIGLSTASLPAATFVVNNLGNASGCDTTTCTLRGAIDAANAAAGADIITFSVSGTISPGSSLAEIHDPAGLTIDGSGQNVTINGGGGTVLIVRNGNLTLHQVTVTSSSSPVSTIIVYPTSTFQAEECTFTGVAGAIMNYDHVSIQNCLFTGSSNGSLFNADDATMTVVDTTFSANVGASYGGAIQNYGTLSVLGSTFSGNGATLDGGALMNYGGATILNSTFSGNSTPTGNPAFLGSAICNISGTLQLSFSTFAGNSGYSTVHVISGSVTMKNTLLGAPAAGFNCFGVTDGGGNLSYPDTTCPGAVLDPKLAALANNGGPTQTMAIPFNSPAIDGAVDCKDVSGNLVLTDQRGASRPQGSQCDIGAYEGSPIFFTGFYPPIANLPAVNSTNAGQAVPITFSLGRNLGLGILAPGYPASQPVDCTTGAVTGPLTVISTPGSSGLTYDSFLNLYTIVWKTDKSWAGTCRQMVLRVSDAVDHVARFNFR